VTSRYALGLVLMGAVTSLSLVAGCAEPQTSAPAAARSAPAPSASVPAGNPTPIAVAAGGAITFDGPGLNGHGPFTIKVAKATLWSNWGDLHSDSAHAQLNIDLTIVSSGTGSASEVKDSLGSKWSNYLSTDMSTIAQDGIEPLVGAWTVAQEAFSVYFVVPRTWHSFIWWIQTGTEVHFINLHQILAVATETPRPQVSQAQAEAACQKGRPIPGTAPLGHALKAYAVALQDGTAGVIETSGVPFGYYDFIEDAQLLPSDIQLVVCKMEKITNLGSCGSYVPPVGPGNGAIEVNLSAASDRMRVVVASTGKTIATKTFSADKHCPRDVGSNETTVTNYPSATSMAGWIASLVK
jgi:hypothetical protein